MLEEADPERLNYLIYNEEYMRLYDEVLAEFDAYMAEPLRVLSEHVTPEHPVAYFSTEYGFSASACSTKTATSSRKSTPTAAR